MTKKMHNSCMQINDQLKIYEVALRDASCQIEDMIQELSLIRRIADISGHVFNLDVFYRYFVDILLEETNAMNCSFMIINSEHSKLIIKVARGRNDDGTLFDCTVESETTFEIGRGIAGSVALMKETLVIPDTRHDNRFELRYTRSPVGSLLCAPIVFQNRILGVVNISHPQANIFNDSNKRLMEISCGLAGTIIGNARMHIQNEQRFRTMFEGVSFSILIIDAESKKIIDCNTYTEKCLGYCRHELFRLEDISAIVSSDLKLKLLEIFAPDNINDQLFYEIPFLLKDGSSKICEINAGKTSYADRDVIRLTINDISEKKKLERKMLQAEKLRSLGELAGGVAHDFNNVLAAILGRVELLRMEAEGIGTGEITTNTTDLIKHLNIIEKASLDGAETVRRIQEFSRIHDEGKYATPLDIESVLEDALEFTRVRWKNIIEAHGATISIQKDIGPLKPVNGSPSELREVFINIINNAADAMPSGGILTLKAFMDDDHVVVHFEDTGIGIPESIRDKIFDPFFTTKDIGSTGLGLSVSYGIINRHKGTIDVQTVEGRGACFRVTLPVCAMEIKKINTIEIPCEQKKTKILIIEDEQSVGDTLLEILTFGGHEVSMATNGLDGISIFAEDRFDIVITDLGMPGLTGFDVAQRIKKINEHIPIILITGWNIKMNKDELHDRGVDYLINKPFQVKQILSLLQSAAQT
jgi:PAS domain S-box-containing protein